MSLNTATALAVAVALGTALSAQAAMPVAVADAAPGAMAGCSVAASTACYFGFEPVAGQGKLHYYASRDPAAAAAPGSATGPLDALIAVHGHPRDADKTFAAALLAVRGADAQARTLVVAPVFQVAWPAAQTCRSAGVPAAAAGDLLWTCSSWVEGGRADDGRGPGAFAAMDALVAELLRRWPSLRQVTVAGFSAGAQMVQHYIGFAAVPPRSDVALRYVVADPGSWLYFDPLPMAASLPPPSSAASAAASAAGESAASTATGTAATAAIRGAAASCPGLNRWKYGTEGLPAHLGRNAAQARAHYAQADVSYLEGELDDRDAPGTFYKILDKSCAAMAQGPFRRQRGEAYLRYERSLPAPARPRQLVVVPGCKHDVACVFPSPAARAALLGVPR